MISSTFRWVCAAGATCATTANTLNLGGGMSQPKPLGFTPFCCSLLGEQWGEPVPRGGDPQMGRGTISAWVTREAQHRRCVTKQNSRDRFFPTDL